MFRVTVTDDGGDAKAAVGAKATANPIAVATSPELTCLTECFTNVFLNISGDSFGVVRRFRSRCHKARRRVAQVCNTRTSSLQSVSTSFSRENLRREMGAPSLSSESHAQLYAQLSARFASSIRLDFAQVVAAVTLMRRCIRLGLRARRACRKNRSVGRGPIPWIWTIEPWFRLVQIPATNGERCRVENADLYSAGEGLVCKSREANGLTDRMFRAKGTLMLALCACACGSSSPGSTGGAGSDPGVVLGQGGDGSAATGSAGSNGLPSAGSNGSSGSTGGLGTSGAGHSAGAGNSGPACPPIAFCGGDLVGDWTVKQVCHEIPATMVQICGFATVGVTPLTADGTVSFKADHTVASSVVYSYRLNVLVPPVCNTGASEASCAAYATAISGGQDGASDAHCNYDPVAGCSCSWTNTESSTISGTYEVMQVASVWITTSPVTNEVDDYCVAGNTLTLKRREGDTIVTTILTR